jgi:hypothetical protein
VGGQHESPFVRRDRLAQAEAREQRGQDEE